MGGIRIAECAADVPEERTTLVDKSFVLTDFGKKKVNSLPSSAIGDSPATAKLLVFRAVTDLESNTKLI